MKQTDISQMFAVPFGAQADSTTITTIPQSKTAIGRASMALGFPKETFTPIAAGGVPPYGEDMNGILNMLAQAVSAAEAGLVRPFSQTYANEINGYPLGAIVSHPSISGRFVMNTQDNNTAAPPGNGWVDQLSDFVTNEALSGSLGNYATTSALQQETQRAEAAEAAILQLPAWMPIPCPLATAPAGYIPADGRSFSTSQCPQLAQGYPNGFVPDLRGLFIRGLDTTGTVDNYSISTPRLPLSVEEGSALLEDTGWSTVNFSREGNSNDADPNNLNSKVNLGWDNRTYNKNTFHYRASGATPYDTAWLNNSVGGSFDIVGVARPKNIAFQYIFRLA